MTPIQHTQQNKARKFVLNHCPLLLIDCPRHQPWEWGRNCVTNPSPSPPVRPRARAVMAMAYYQLNQPEAAQAELAQCREIIESKFIGKVVTGDWSSTGYSFDWMIDRILLREADALIQTGPKNGGGQK